MIYSRFELSFLSTFPTLRAISPPSPPFSDCVGVDIGACVSIYHSGRDVCQQCRTDQCHTGVRQHRPSFFWCYTEDAVDV